MSYIKPNTDYEVGMFLMENIAQRRGREDDDNVPEGWFNHIFEHEPTTEQAMDWVNRTWFITNKKADLYKAKRMNKLMKDEDIDLISSRIITLQFDKKNHKDVMDSRTFNRAFCEIYVNEMKKSNYRVIILLSINDASSSFINLFILFFLYKSAFLFGINQVLFTQSIACSVVGSCSNI